MTHDKEKNRKIDNDLKITIHHVGLGLWVQVSYFSNVTPLPLQTESRDRPKIVEILHSPSPWTAFS